MSENKIYEIVRDNIIKQLNENGGRWCCPWNHNIKFAKPYYSEPDEYYKGVNILLNRPSEYVTMHMIKELQEQGQDISIRKGSHMNTIYYYNFVEQKDENGEPVVDEQGKTVKKPFFKFYKVFSIDDVIGLESRVPFEEHEHTLDEKMKQARMYIDTYCKINGIDMQVKTGGTSAYYRPSENSITIPDISQYKNPYEYFSTVFHEVSHFIDHKLHLTSGINEKVKIDNYSAGELLAEISAAMMCQQFGIDDLDTFANSVSYIDSWSKKIKEERASFIVSVASKASQCVDELVGSVEKALLLQRAQETDEIVFKSGDMIFNIFINSDSDFEYNIYKYSFGNDKVKEFDGGILERSSEIRNVFDALNDLAGVYGIEPDTMTAVSIDDLENLLSGDILFEDIEH